MTTHYERDEAYRYIDTLELVATIYKLYIYIYKYIYIYIYIDYRTIIVNSAKIKCHPYFFFLMGSLWFARITAHTQKVFSVFPTEFISIFAFFIYIYSLNLICVIYGSGSIARSRLFIKRK